MLSAIPLKYFSGNYEALFLTNTALDFACRGKLVLWRICFNVIFANPMKIKEKQIQ